MIEADAFELQTVLRQTVIHIRQREVILFTDQFAVLAGTATFLASLAFGGLLMSTNFLERGGRSHEYCSDLVGCDAPSGASREGILFNNEVIIIAYYSFVTLAVFCNFVVVFISVYCLIFGPELAIRGAEKEQKRAIKGMYEERTSALKFFQVGCAFIVLSAGALGWLKYPEPTAVIITGVFFLLLIWGVYYIYYYVTPLFAYVDAEGLDCRHLHDHDADDEANTLRQQQQQQHNRDRGSMQATTVTHTAPTSDALLPSWFRHMFSQVADERTSTHVAPSSPDVRRQPQHMSEEESSVTSIAPPPSLSSGSHWESVRSIFRSSHHHSTSSRQSIVLPPAPVRDFYATSKSAPLTVDGAARHGLLEDGHLRVFDLNSGEQCLDLNLHEWTLHIDRSEPDIFILLSHSVCHHLCGADFDDTQHWIRAVMANISNLYKPPDPMSTDHLDPRASGGATTASKNTMQSAQISRLEYDDFFEDLGDDEDIAAGSRPSSNMNQDEHKSAGGRASDHH